MRKILRGVAASPGVGLGTVQLYRTEKIDGFKREIQDRAGELERYRASTERFCELWRQRAERIAPLAGREQADILLTQVAMAQDPYLVGQVEGRIAAFQSAEFALDEACSVWQRSFLESDSELTRLRAADIQDLRDGLLRVLLGLPEADLSRLSPETVLIAKELSPSAMTALDPRAVAGIVLCRGGRASHCAILARALGIPAVVGVEEAVAWARSGERVVVDGTEGLVHFSPTTAEMKDWQSRRSAAVRELESLRRYAGRSTETADGQALCLTASVGSEGEAMMAREYGCDGIGLLRSEFLYLERPSMPGEEEQYRSYAGMVKLSGGPTVIRTLDIGGDKQLAAMALEPETNPFLGCRAIRLSRREAEMFKLQLRAILRAGAMGDVRLLIPMVTGLEELRWVRARLKECEEELRREGSDFREGLPVGVMVETPAAALTIDLLIREADFVSIGTNDLTQYTMAVDRDNPRVSALYSHYDPALLRLIRQVIAVCRERNVPVAMCGQAAADPLFLPLLLAFGLREFSVQPSLLLSTRRRLSLWSLDEARALAETALTLETEEEVRRLLEENEKN